MSLTRREALRLLSTGLMAWVATAATRAPLVSLRWGRVAWDRVEVYERPSFSAPRRMFKWKDEVVSLAGTVLAQEPAYNPLWYRLAEGGYVHSGGVQPVEIHPQRPQPVPPGGSLAQVTVPYTDAFFAPSRRMPHAYRLYYATTYWVVEALPGPDDPDEIWYRIEDDRWQMSYFAPARHFRLLTPEDVAPISPHVPPEQKRIVVDLKNQFLLAYEGARVVFVTRVSTGARFPYGDFRTPTGTFSTSYKRPSRHMAQDNRALHGYDLPGVPWVCYIIEDGIALHGTYWHNDFGRPRSSGCINLSPAAAWWIYRWTNPVVPFGQRLLFRRQGATRVDVVEEFLT